MRSEVEMLRAALDEIYEIVKAYDQSPTVSAKVLEVLERLD
jgi:multidrug efflux pump subunit AcrB